MQPELFSRWTLPISQPSWRRRQRRRKRASSSFTKLVTTLTARSPTRSGSARERTINDPGTNSGWAGNDGIVRNESKDRQVYEHPTPLGYADIARSRGLGPGYFVAGTTAGASAESRCCPYASCCEREWPGCLRF